MKDNEMKEEEGEEEEIKSFEEGNKVLKTNPLFQILNNPNLSGKKKKDNLSGRPPWIPTK